MNTYPIVELRQSKIRKNDEKHFYKRVPLEFQVCDKIPHKILHLLIYVLEFRKKYLREKNIYEKNFWNKKCETAEKTLFLAK